MSPLSLGAIWRAAPHWLIRVFRSFKVRCSMLDVRCFGLPRSVFICVHPWLKMPFLDFCLIPALRHTHLPQRRRQYAPANVPSIRASVVSDPEDKPVELAN